MDINNILNMMNLLQNGNKAEMLQNILKNDGIMQNIKMDTSTINNNPNNSNADMHHLIKSLYDKEIQ